MKALFFTVLRLSCSKDETPTSDELTLSNPAAATEPMKIGAEKVIRGKISIIPELQKNLKQEQVLFVIARDFQTEQVVAVKKYKLITLPLDFLLTPSDQVLPNTKFNGPYRISVKIDV